MYSLKFFSRSNDRVKETFNQYNRSRYLKLLFLNFYQFRYTEHIAILEGYH